MTATLVEVYLQAIEVVEERGFTSSFEWRKNAPVDLPQALAAAQKTLHYHGSMPDPVSLLAGWVGMTLTNASQTYDADRATALFRWAARNAERLLTEEPVDSPVKEPVVKRAVKKVEST